MDHRLNTRQRGDAVVKKANFILGCSNRSVEGKTRELRVLVMSSVYMGKRIQMK